MLKQLSLAILTLLFSTNIFSATLVSTEDEQRRSVELYKHIKCLVCKGESIYESNSTFSNNVKKLVQEKIQSGYNNEEILQFLREKYGNHITNKNDNELCIIISIIFTVMLPSALLLMYKYNLNK